MNEKTSQLLNDFILELPESYQQMFLDLAGYTISLDYTPKKTKSKDFVLDFSKSKVKRTILKMEIHDNGQKRNGPGLRQKFYANVFRCGNELIAIRDFSPRNTTEIKALLKVQDDFFMERIGK